MKLYYIILSVFLCCTAFVGCSKDNAEVLPNGQLPETISLDIKICPSTNGSRAGMGDPAIEEGKVTQLLYGVFKNEKLMKSEIIENLTLNTGDNYRIQGLNTEWFLGGGTEIFVVANPQSKEFNQGVTIKDLVNNKKPIADWKNYKYTLKEELNSKARNNPSRKIEEPLMTGYLSISNVQSSGIVVPVDHAYARIWFTFGWKGTQQAEEIIVDKVTVDKLVNRIKIFYVDTGKDGFGPGTSTDMNFKEVIANNDEKQKPFMACLTPEQGENYHWGDVLQMVIPKNQRNTYNVLSRYTCNSDGSLNQTAPPVRYYIYSCPWYGTSPEDDPIITVDYHFIKNNNTVYKRASARMYDPNYKPGKRHHGILRNYTYQVYCFINTTTNKLDLQVTARPWIEEIVDDIPAFE